MSIRDLFVAGLVSFLLMLPGIAYSQDNNPLEAVERQINAFNHQDIDALVANVAEDFKWYWISSDTLILELEGRDKLARSMRSYFDAYPTVWSVLGDKVILGNRITFKESVYWTREDGSPDSAASVATYQTENGLISRVWYFID